MESHFGFFCKISSNSNPATMMDLWDSSQHFLVTRMASGTAGNFLTSDILGLAYKWGVKAKARSNSVQVLF
jgi:hypothetical protein